MQNRKPAWWQLFLLVPIMFVLLILEHYVPLPGVSAEIVDAGIVVLTFAAMLVWVHVNGGLLEQYEVDSDQASQDLKITVYEPASKAKGDGDGSGNSTPFALPHSEERARDGKVIQLKEKDKWFLN
jgi:hypothetical protein